MIGKEVKSMTAMLIILKIMNVWKTSDHHVADDRGDHDEREGRGPSQVQATPLTENTVMIIIVVTNMTMMISTDREGRFYKNIWTHLNSPLKAFLLQCAASERSCLVFRKVQCPHCSKSNLQRREEGEKLPHQVQYFPRERILFWRNTKNYFVSKSSPVSECSLLWWIAINTFSSVWKPLGCLEHVRYIYMDFMTIILWWS